MTSFQSIFESSLYFLHTWFFSRYSPFYSRLFLFCFAFLYLYFAYFNVLSNSAFSRLTLRLLLLVFFGRFVSSFPAYFHFLHELELKQCLAVDKALALPILLLCKLIRNFKYWELMFHYNLTGIISRTKLGLQIICMGGFTSASPREAHL